MMTFELDEIFVEETSRASVLAHRVIEALSTRVPIRFVADARAATLADRDAADPFGKGKRRMVIMRRRGAFLMGCPAASARYACCGYLVLALASNCPMDCSYCFLQDYLADNPAFQVYSNYTDVFAELERLAGGSRERQFRVGTGEFADSLAFDSVTGLAREFVEFFAAHRNLTLELKTKTDEIDGLLAVEPRGSAMVSWTVSPERVYRSSERRTAPPSARLRAARRVLEAGYRVAFHLDPIIAYPGAEDDYLRLAEEILDTVAPEKISFVSMGSLRMTPALRTTARRRFPNDPMLLGEEILCPDGRYRAFMPLRLRLYRKIAERFSKAGAPVRTYLCMEPASVHRQVFAAPALAPADARERLCCTG